MNITIKIIPHKKQRYDTSGDWIFKKNGDLEIRISSMKNWKYETLVAIHELIEVVLCKDRKISQKEVDKFDKLYEENRKMGDYSEPGDSPLAPYRMEHGFATMVEKMMAAELNVDWKEYDEKVINL